MEPSDIVLLVLGVICPPGSAALKRGLNREFIICTVLTLALWLPGVAYSWYLVFKYPLEDFWKRGSAGQYHSIEEGLRRHSLNSTTVSDDGPACHSDEDASRSTTMTSETATQQQQQQQQQSQDSRPGRGRKPRRSRNVSGNASRRGPPNALHEAARSYALRHQQRQETNAVTKWFVDRFYFPDPTQVPPSTEPMPSELHDLDGSR
ncbi:hypothetical protein LPJ61_003244 [Coemansia biformis]|uniref:Uncharacterized protein n=1 Tax=Coemansia biformis TaxID=1286918 RepID=A0A9W8CXW1_9FUNG|nr:hypothetical protein LPJ61_003244 [Coemansia biformis]